MNITAFRNRLQIDTTERKGISEILHGGAPFFWNGSCVQFELGFFRGETIVDDLSNINELTIELKSLTDLTGAALMTSTILGDDLNSDLTAVLWTGGLEDNCHAKVFFAAADADLDLGGGTTKDFWLVITAKRSDGQPITLGCSRITVQEDGSSVAPTATTGYFRYHEGLPQSQFSDGSWHSWKPVFDQGQYILDVDQNAASDIADGDFTKTRFSDGYMELLFPDATWHRIDPIFDQGQYLIDVDQAEAGAYSQDNSYFRQRLGHAEMKWLDLSWHRIKPVFDQNQYLLDVEQSASV